MNPGSETANNPNTTATTHKPFPAGVRRATLLRLAFIVNSLADSPRIAHLPLSKVRAAAQDGSLIELLSHYAGRCPDLSFLESPPGTLDELNSALRLSCTVLTGKEIPKAGVYRNGWCLALALVLYAIRERSPQLWPDHPVSGTTRVNSTKLD